MTLIWVQLTCEVEGRPFVPEQVPRTTSVARANASAALSRSQAAAQRDEHAQPQSAFSQQQQQPSQADKPPSRGQNEAFFARRGDENAKRPAYFSSFLFSSHHLSDISERKKIDRDVPPSQGGRYAGFGSAPSGFFLFSSLFLCFSTW